MAQQIGAQIFIDGWAMISPGDPELAADLARRAASVSHDGEALYGAQIIAAMEAQAFVERDLGVLLDTAVRLIPQNTVIYRLIQDVREWHAAQPDDWRATRAKIAQTYGYDTYGGPCHIVPNHALIMLGLLYGGDDFQTALMITTTAGWDTDCNVANVGCLLGIKNGLTGIDAGPDWRGPIADRLYLPTADGGRAISDAASEACQVVTIGRALVGDLPLTPKGGARFHFAFPGSVQGFQTEEASDTRGVLTLESVAGHSVRGERSLALRYRHLARGRAARTSTPTFVPPGILSEPGYTLLASPTLYPGQIVRAGVASDAANAGPVSARLHLQVHDATDRLEIVYGPDTLLQPGVSHTFECRVPQVDGQPIAAIGLELRAARRADGTVYLDYLTWDGMPDVTLGRPLQGGTMWRRAWVDGIDQYESRWPEPYRLMHNEGSGLLIQGTRAWTDYGVSATLTPHMVASVGIGARMQRMRRYYAFLLSSDGVARLVKALDGDTVLAEAPLAWVVDRPYDLDLQVEGTRLRAVIDGHVFFDVEDTDRALMGGVALICMEGCVSSTAVIVRPLAH